GPSGRCSASSRKNSRARSSIARFSSAETSAARRARRNGGRESRPSRTIIRDPAGALKSAPHYRAHHARTGDACRVLLSRSARLVEIVEPLAKLFRRYVAGNHVAVERHHRRRAGHAQGLAQLILLFDRVVAFFRRRLLAGL